MSVAFRRESDEEHLEPRFELPIPAGPNLVTRAAPAQYRDRVAVLEAAIATADDPAPLQRELRYWRTRATTAEIVEAPTGDEAGIGSRVRIRLAGRERSVAIVGHDEADAAERIAYAAPLARALIGAAAGDVVAFQGRDDAIEVLAIDNEGAA